MHLIKTMHLFSQGNAFWKVFLNTGKAYSELDVINDPSRGKRNLDWYLDIVANGDVKRIAELWLYTPIGHVALKITEPRSAFILNTGIYNNKTGNDGVSKAIGRVDDKENGTGIAFIWDSPLKQIFKDDKANVYNFQAWRPGICNPGALNLGALGIIR